MMKHHAMNMCGEVNVRIFRPFMSRPLYTRIRIPRYPLNGKLIVPQCLSERYGIEKNPFPVLGIESRSSSPTTVAVPTGLTRLRERMISES
jgi:hypothetical protein